MVNTMQCSVSKTRHRGEARAVAEQHQPNGTTWIHEESLSRETPEPQTLPEIFGGFWCLVSAVDFLGGFFRAIFLGKTSRKNPPKNPPNNPRFSRQLFDQNPLREISALRNFSELRNL